MNLQSLQDTTDPSLIDDAIARLQAQGARFADVYQQMLADESAASADPQIYTQWQDYKSKADTIKNTIGYINSKVDTATNWLRDVFGLSALNTLAFLPLLPLAYITAAIAAITYFVSDYMKWRQGLAAGFTPAQINTGSVSSQISSTVMWAAIGLAVVFVLPKLLEKR